ncbi:MAG: bifunctional (p)ppGpp synthetase/guanosine-3',5'-bis(diphosphate) 3'-pyrophosphohydrolase [Epulopiscium sp.]|nr:bifunctional (p)ppGpp synthetase/guanosine-3',5'-bis(diphosphate) 3'-pyrophosphohydrolase [Candidatus Epulonipiscium sp.]HOQ16086.1 bifunctional (p)ppGpp synthetase/guanosine-3',5'-bis(diphosphate) 3'-pyrophosphohydrolase [Defluviitaleaceae bacterium]HPT75822.1 bifunctional (p)ppGpp synthetase/guanosine-3',5'-bis(diphosphate) 3'-pyrophosphohydrolase [Defluviitaleaceae bacterium]
MSDQIIYEKLISLLKSYHPSNDFSLVEKAYRFAKEAHEGQHRKSGEPYVIHPLEVAVILAELELDIESITAGILHDILEDTDHTFEELAGLFGEEVARLVDGVTKLGKINFSSNNKELQKEEIQAENYRKMFLAMAQDIRVILIKLADRLHNMRTLRFMPPEKQKEKANETLHIYAPLAHRLGISKIKVELDDLALRYLEPEVYYDLAEKIAKRRIERIEYVERIVKEVKTKLDEAGIKATVEGRPKHFFSIYKKMIGKNVTLDQIYDLFAIRAIVETVKDCYGVLGIVHEMYKPIPGRFKDYIAMPKPNMYQSLHTSLIGPEGEPFEVQIRTREMHKVAEYGIAAHWRYKEGKKGTKVTDKSQDKTEEKLAWLRQILEWQREMSDNKEFLDALKMDLDIFSDQVYAFTPKGDVISLPYGSTPIDFAYMIHSAVGNKMVGAKVNGKIVTFDYQIKNGDRVEILTSQNSRGPSRDWLKNVKSSQARSKINQWFKKQYKQENINRGKELLEKDAKKRGLNINDLLKAEWIEKVLRKYGFQDWDAVCAAVGHGGIKEGQVIHRLYEEYRKENAKNLIKEETITIQDDSKKPVKKSKSGVVIEGVGDVAVRFSKCCNPVPGDEIIGFITRGRGVSIHRTDCINILNISEEEKDRLIEAEWLVAEKDFKNITYQTEIKVIGEDRMGLIVDISRVLTEEKIPVKALNARTTKNNESIINITIEISGIQQLETIIKKIRSIPGINDIIRTTT